VLVSLGYVSVAHARVIIGILVMIVQTQNLKQDSVRCLPNTVFLGNHICNTCVSGYVILSLSVLLLMAWSCIYTVIVNSGIY
jgi:high-affinity nickel permease